MNAKEIFRETVFGNPTRYSNNYEALLLTFSTPFMFHSPMCGYGQENVVDAWGVTNSWPLGTPGGFPVHTPEKVVIKDFENWQDYVKFPNLKFPEAEWEPLIAQYEAIDKSNTYAAPFVAPGIFERLHHLGRMENTLMAFYECEDEIADLIKAIVDWELELAEGIVSHIHPDVLFHHDDWGSFKSTFMSPSMFEDFFVEAYQQVYGYYKKNGVEMVVHHSDSYGATLVPAMIDMGINVWQGCTSTNDLPKLVKEYGDKITFMGGFDGAAIDKSGITKEEIKKFTYEYIDSVGTPKGFVPCIAQGGPGSVYKNVYEYLWESIDEYNMDKMGATEAEINDRAPRAVLFPGMME